MVRETSLLAWIDILEHLGDRQKEVYKALKELKTANNTMIANHMGLSINQVTPRIFELRRKGVVRMDRIDTCPQTSRKSTFWRIIREL